jgi:hypothetical protein
MESMGGSELMVPAHPTVIILGFPEASAHVTITTGTGLSIVDGFQTCFAILQLLLCHNFDIIPEI